MRRPSIPFLWVAAIGANGEPDLTPSAPVCPAVDALSAAKLLDLGVFGPLACYGNAELTLRGDVRCQSVTADYAVGGASWLDAYHACGLDDALHLGGPVAGQLLDGQVPPAQPVSGRFEVRGHFDDPEARACFSIAFGAFVSSPVSAPEPAAVVSCRQTFVVTSLTPLD